MPPHALQPRSNASDVRAVRSVCIALLVLGLIDHALIILDPILSCAQTLLLRPSLGLNTTGSILLLIGLVIQSLRPLFTFLERSFGGF